MDIRLELLSGNIAEKVCRNLDQISINVDSIIESNAVKMLSEIQTILGKDELSDFCAIEEIVCVFEKYNVDFGGRHDF